jgi:hypothetical protein
MWNHRLKLTASNAVIALVGPLSLTRCTSLTYLFYFFQILTNETSLPCLSLHCFSFCQRGGCLLCKIPSSTSGSYFICPGPSEPRKACEAIVHGGALYMPLGDGREASGTFPRTNAYSCQPPHEEIIVRRRCVAASMKERVRSIDSSIGITSVTCR